MVVYYIVPIVCDVQVYTVKQYAVVVEYSTNM